MMGLMSPEVVDPGGRSQEEWNDVDLARSAPADAF